MNSILIPESLLHEKTYNADKYFNERFPSDYATMEANPNYSESGCGIAVTASDTENTLSIKDPADSSRELCKLTYSNGKLKFTYKKPAMVNNITMVGVGSTEKLNILDNNFDILHLNVVKKLGGAYVPNTSFDNLISVCYGNGKFVAVGNNSNAFAYSTDGATWTQGTMPSSQYWISICYGNGKFVAVVGGGDISSDAFAYSTDGATWTQGTMPSSQYWTSVCYGNGKYVAITLNSDVFAYSTDGITWTQSTMPSTQLWRSICYGNGKFVTVSTGFIINNGSNIFAYSTDGITWTQGTLPSNREWQSVCYGNGKFVAVAYQGIFAYSYDGINWTEGNMSDSIKWISVCYGNGKFVAVAYNDNNIMFAYSYNGYKWYTVALDQSLYKDSIYHSYSSVCYSPDHNFFVTVNSPTIISIPDAYAGGVCNTFAVEYSWSGAIPSGVTLPNPTSYTSGTTVTVDTKYTSDSIVQELGEWTAGTMPSSDYWGCICYGNSTFVAITISQLRNIFAYSTDGITWTEGTMPSSQYWMSVCYGNGKFVAVSGDSYHNSNVFAYSTDGINWTQGTMPSSQAWGLVCYGNGKFVAVTLNSNVFAYSTDGINWTEGTMPSSKSWISVCYGNGKFVAVSRNSNVFAYSTDGITWTEGTMPSSQYWMSVCYGSGKFVAVSRNSNVFAYSTDGITWTEGTMPSSQYWTSVCYGSGKFVAVPGMAVSSNIFAYSTDGINWTEGTMPSTDIWTSVYYGNGKFVAVSRGTDVFAYLTPPSTYYQFSGWNKSGTFNITSDTSITGRWTQKSKLSVTYSWTNAPTGMTSTVPAKVTGLMPNETVAVDTKYTNKSAYKDTTNKKYYKFSGWNKSGEFNITSNTNISGSWDNGTSAPNMVDFGKMSVGSTFFLGKYQVESEDPWDIEWEIVHQTADYQIAITKQIIDLRPFDGKESTNPDSDRKNYGNSNWQYSNIEQWLNSDQSNWYSAQHSADALPSSDNVWVNNNVAYNPYDTKPGFLYYWSDEEKSVLQDMTLTLANNTVTDGGGSYTWTGKIWLPTYTQLTGSQNNNISEGTQFSKFTDNASRVKTIHAMCAANNQYCIDKGKTEGTACNYWMSSASPSFSCHSRFVKSDGTTDYSDTAYVGLYGLAPCICLPRTGSFGTPSDLNYVD